MSLGLKGLKNDSPHDPSIYIQYHGKWFEPRGISYLFGVSVRVRVVFRKTVVGSHHL